MLFPALAAARPELAEVLRRLRQDHSMISHLIHGFAAVVESSPEPGELARHLDGIEAIMESHFGYEERQLRPALARLDLAADVRTVFGPLADVGRLPH